MNKISDILHDNPPKMDGEKRTRKRRSKEEIIEDLQAKLAKVSGRESGLDLKEPKSMEKEISVFVGECNSLLLLTPWTNPEALEQMEAMALIQGWDQAQMTDPKFRKWTTKFIGGSGKFSLIGAVALIAANRLIRHNIIPMPDEVKEQMNRQMAEMGERMMAEMQQRQAQEQAREQARQQAQSAPTMSEVWEPQPVG